MMILRQGSRGINVVKLQTLLRDLGYFKYPKITDYFGGVTKEAVLKFQKDKRLVADGIVGRNTWDALSDAKVSLKSTTSSGAKFEDLGGDINIWSLPRLDDKYPTSKSALELVKFIKQFKFNRRIDKVVWHCTASHQSWTTKNVMDYFLKTLKWERGGYHIVIDARGEWTYCVDFNIASNGVSGMNSNIINISYIGGIDKNLKSVDNRTPEQKDTMELVYFALKDALPKVSHHGHKEFARKDCPCFEVKDWAKSLDIRIK